MNSLNDFDCILLIDDDPIINFVTNRFLRKAGYQNEIIKFEHSLEGFDYVKAVLTSFDLGPCSVLIFLDINMPVLNGWGFLEQFEKLPAKAKEVFRIVILTSSYDPKDIKMANDDKNVSGYVVKPLSIFRIGEVEDYLEKLRF
ncbi:CheY-like receiver domain-containing protein [Belliella baltica DSM 15883]|uniref:CheY-like receiver domain-containing protein n=1 Tax=Belliella baltica (strain DSM 15883 / CIP 108006 / LMG 21964 / BA134) TaxID=866536 RepID=I3Z775_BELBD|nr:response regulator [Belliella baltica]AFL85093.1 CheY-like receiver domain-containing protein [Belliella baltica DSM 15883]